ncbi:MAG: LPS export ABC transporter ATP-binding protein [Coxiellaceae bacterium]|nr:LPS export ABC transporter ATP-binding protein [Coxiellaceae bacterium]
MSNLRIEHLQKQYKTRKVVKDVSLTLNDGEVVGLLGPNGAGKTTSFYMVVGLIAADKGKVILDDQDISHMAMHQRARLGIGYLPQEPSIFRKLSVADNIMAILELNRELNREQRHQQLDSLLSELHIGHLKDSMGISLSGGERRRVEIARALAIEPKFILLDEPFAGIDPISVIDIKRIIGHLRDRGIGVLITDHNVRETLDICHRAYIVSDGCIIASGSPQDVLTNQTVREVYLGDEFDL